jgi:hypothetical protein
VLVANLVTLSQAKSHLRVIDDAQDDDILGKLDAAESIVLDYINTTVTWRTTTAAWTEDTVPTFVRAAILLQLGELFKFRGDNDGPKHEAGQLSPVVTNLLRRSRDPVLA